MNGDDRKWKYGSMIRIGTIIIIIIGGGYFCSTINQGINSTLSQEIFGIIGLVQCAFYKISIRSNKSNSANVCSLTLLEENFCGFSINTNWTQSRTSDNTNSSLMMQYIHAYSIRMNSYYILFIFR